MLKLLRILAVLFLLSAPFALLSQKDTSQPRKKLINISSDSSLVFTGTRIVEKEDTTPGHNIVIGGYVCGYYAHYSDATENSDGFVQFPTMAPRNNQFGLNLVQFSMDYRSKVLRSNIILHYGDIPESVWPRPFNLIQEAHAGFRIVKGLWLDAGFFKTHIGLESIQPRENVTSSMAVLTFYEPYYLSGAKLTCEVNSKLSLQVNMFNGYNEYVEDNKNKALGFSALYDVNKHVSVTYNFLTCDETLDNVPVKHQRYYNNLYATFKFPKLDIGVEANYGLQEHSLKGDTSKTASMFSGLIVARYALFKKLSMYGRGEYFSDPSQILTGSLNIGQYIYGGTFGLEYKPAINMGLSVEGRLLQSDNLIFRQQNYRLNQRYEFIVCLDVWF